MTTTSGQPNLRQAVLQANRIANSVVHVSDAIKELEKGALTEEAIMILLAHKTKLPQKTIREVLNGLAKLSDLYVKPQQKGKGEHQ